MDQRRALILFLILLLGSLCWSASYPPPRQTLENALKSGQPVIIMLSSNNCPACLGMKPILKELADEVKGKILILDINIYERRDLAREYNVSLIPTLLFFDRQGKFKFKSAGYMGKKELLETIADLKLNK